MYVDEKSSGSNPQRSSEQLLQDIERALESAGVSGDVLSQVTQSLKGNGNGNGRATPIATIGELIISDNARTILEERYLRKDADGNAIEAPEDLFHRVSNAIAQGEAPAHQAVWENKFYDMMTSLKFLPNSPTLVNAGTGRGCLSACFVVSPEDDMESIMEVAHDAAMIEKWGGGIGFGFSNLRPKYDAIRTD